MSASGYRIKEPVEFDIEPETGKLASRLVDLHLKELGYSLEELAEAVKINPLEFATMHGLVTPGLEERLKPKPKLRLVASRD
jgi:hypothetical protein